MPSSVPVSSLSIPQLQQELRELEYSAKQFLLRYAELEHELGKVQSALDGMRKNRGPIRDRLRDVTYELQRRQAAEERARNEFHRTGGRQY